MDMKTNHETLSTIHKHATDLVQIVWSVVQRHEENAKIHADHYSLSQPPPKSRMQILNVIHSKRLILKKRQQVLTHLNPKTLHEFSTTQRTRKKLFETPTMTHTTHPIPTNTHLIAHTQLYPRTWS